MECPSKECHAHVQVIKKTVTGLVATMGTKISTNLAVAFLAFALTFSSGFILYALAGDKKKVEAINQNTQQIAVIQKELEHISASQAEMKESIKRIEDKQITKIEIVDAVKKALSND